jgi:hypothetical protein
MKRLAALTICGLALTGCAEKGTPVPDATTPATLPAPATATTLAANADDEEGHSHGAGPHGGVVADWGGGAYHVEFTVDHDKKTATVYLLGSDAQTIKPIKAEKITLSIDEPAFQLDLAAQPQDGEAPGESSRFVGQHDNLGVVREFSGSITGELEGTPYAGDFAEGAHE